MRILVCGGRDYVDSVFIDLCLSRVHQKKPITLIIHGGASGADKLAGRWAHRHGVRAVEVPADWASHGKAAGPMRNQLMLDVHRPDGVVAFPGGRGTADMISRAKKAGLKVWQPAAGLTRSQER